MGTIKGQNLRIFIGDKCVAMATSCQVNVALQTEDSSSKDNTGNWAENEPVGKSWKATTNSLVVLSDANSGKTAVDLLGLIINETKVQLKFDETDGAQNRVGQNSAIKRTGYAYLNDYNLNAPNRQNSTVTCEFIGTGALE